MSDHRILIAADVPFWRRSTGAEQRIAGLTDFLIRQSFDVRVFYLSGISFSDKTQIADSGLNVVLATSDKPPADTVGRLRWYGDATLNQFKTWFAKQTGQGDSDATAIDSARPQRLEDFRWPWAMDQFRDCVKDLAPDSILIEYVKLAYLIDGLSHSQRGRVRLLIDTHDLIHLRNQQFIDRGFPHWLSISRAEESAALKVFDTILAIQSSEAASFREMAPAAKTIVVGHSFEQQLTVEPKNRPSDDCFVVGYVGSANFSNSSAILNMLSTDWGRTASNSPPIQLRIAGAICQWLAASEFAEEIRSHPNIELIGFVDDLDEFYESVDLIINPVEFGTGLKIKNCEALCYGVPLLTMRSGLQSMPSGCEKLAWVSDSHSELVDTICRLAIDRSDLENQKNQLSIAARSLFSDAAAYTELLETLRS